MCVSHIVEQRHLTFLGLLHQMKNPCASMVSGFFYKKSQEKKEYEKMESCSVGFNIFEQKNDLLRFESFCYNLMEQRMIDGDYQGACEIIGVMKEVELI